VITTHSLLLGISSVAVFVALGPDA